MQCSRAFLATSCVVAILAGLASMRPGAAAQQGASPANTTQTLQVYTRLTVLDVTAIDANEQPVHGLTQADFTVREDGKPQPVRNFEEVSSHPVGPPLELPPDVYTNLQPPPPSRAVNILLLDLLNEAPIDDTVPRQVAMAAQTQHFVKQAAVQAVLNMPAGTQVAVLAMTNNLRILQSFTSDKTLLTAAINAVPYDLQGTPLGGIQANSRNQSVLEVFDRIAIDSMAIHGRKNLIWFTMGIPQITIPNDRPGSLPDYSVGLSHAYDLLTAAQVSVYPVDARGVTYLGDAQLSEQMVAEATGGVAYTETNDLATAVDKALNNGANYYSLSYIPPDTHYDGAYHKIDVKVDRTGVTLTFRTGYFADDVSKIKMPPGLSLSTTPPPAVNGNMKAPMSRGLATSTDILFDVEVKPSATPRKPGAPLLGTLNPALQGRRLTRYGLQYAVPSQQIVFKDGSKQTHDGNLDFDIAVYDTNDKLLTGLSQVVKVTLSDDKYKQMLANQEPIQLYQQIDLPPGQLFLRVGVLDHNSDKVGTLELPLNIGKK